LRGTRRCRDGSSRGRSERCEAGERCASTRGSVWASRRPRQVSGVVRPYRASALANGHALFQDAVDGQRQKTET
jgi:hypothetical protein